MRIVIALVAIALVVPEVARYRGERRLRLVDAALATAARQRLDAATLRRVSAAAEETKTYAGDWRPLVAAGRASYAGGDYRRAVTLFERANAFGERPEIDVNLGAALLRLGETRRAEELFERAIALAPALKPEVDRLRAR